MQPKLVIPWYFKRLGLGSVVAKSTGTDRRKSRYKCSWEDYMAQLSYRTPSDLQVGKALGICRRIELYPQLGL